MPEIAIEIHTQVNRKNKLRLVAISGLTRPTFFHKKEMLINVGIKFVNLTFLELSNKEMIGRGYGTFRHCPILTLSYTFISRLLHTFLLFQIVGASYSNTFFLF